MLATPVTPVYEVMLDDVWVFGTVKLSFDETRTGIGFLIFVIQNVLEGL